MTLLFLSFVACESGEDSKGGDLDVDTADTGDTGDTAVKPPDVVLGDPYAVVVGASSPGSWASTCDLDLTLKNNADGSTAATIELLAKGCDWAGAPLTGGTQYKGYFSATSCVLGQDKTYESSTFSGQKGYIMALWYSGVNIGYAALEQGEEEGDFYGGQAKVVVANSYPDTNVQAHAADLGVAAELVSTGASGNTYTLTWDSELNVGQVLSDFTAAAGDDFVAGEPVWISKPSWWPKCIPE